MPAHYTPYQQFISRFFTCHIRKLPIDVGCSCPVRDGTKGRKGCSFCNGRSFVTAASDRARSVACQLAAGKLFYRRQIAAHPDTAFLAYFQAGSNTYAPLNHMVPLFEEALSVEGVRGLVLATRPDCLSSEWLDYLARLGRDTFVMVELGVESLNVSTLRAVGRGHTVEQSAWAVQALAERAVPVGIHLLFGLPGDDCGQMRRWSREVSRWPVDVLKLHQLQILQGARMAGEYAAHPERFRLFTPREYVSLVVDFLEGLSPRIAVERFVSQAPPGTLLAPRWGMKNDDVLRLIEQEMIQRGTFQGKKFVL